MTVVNEDELVWACNATMGALCRKERGGDVSTTWGREKDVRESGWTV